MPGWLTRWFLRARATLSARHDRELRDELQLHLHLLEEEYRAQGIPPDVARRRAHHEFGNATLFQEASHDLFSFRLFEDVVQDLRYAVREMRRNVGFTSVAVLSLAIGIGAVTTTFALMDAFMLRGLPVRDPERLVAFSTTDNVNWGSWSYASFTRWRTSPDALVDVAATSDVRSYEVRSRGSETPAEVHVSLVSGNYFGVMGADIALGRALTEGDAGAPGAAAVAVISDAFWERWFGRAPDVLSQGIVLQGVRHDVVGVARQGFAGHAVARPTDLWVPLTMQPAIMPAPGLLDDNAASGARWLKIVGRIPAAVSLERAAVSANLIRQRFLEEKAAELGAGSPELAGERKRVVSLRSAATGYAPERGRYARPLMILSAITALVLLVACANFTNLMLARSEGRRKEFVIRLALGGGRWRLIRHSATECILLAVVAGVLGVIFASWATSVSVKQLTMMRVPVELALAIDARVLSFAGACVAVAIAFGIWPCTRPARSASVTTGYQPVNLGVQRRTRSIGGKILLVAQLAMCTVLLIGAGLFLRTVTNLRSQELGFDRSVLLIPLSPGKAGYSEPAAAMLLQRVRERLSAVPGIRAVGISGAALMDHTNYWIDGSQRLTTDRGVVLPGARWTFAAVGPGFFDAVGMPLVSGRAFDDRDAHVSADGVVINRSLATILFGQENPIGRRLRMSPRGPLQPVIGLVNDAKQTSPRDRGMGVVYLPLRGSTNVVLAVRTAGRPSDQAPVVRHHLRAIAGDLPVEKVRTISDVLDEAIAQERLMSLVSSFLAVLAIAIGCTGLYALMSFDVAQRTHELGIRMAMGATSANVVMMVLRDSAALVVPGLAVGVPLGIAASRPLSSQLYGVQAGDLPTVAAVTLLLVAVTLLATFRPAHTASRIDPIALLRHE